MADEEKKVVAVRPGPDGTTEEVYEENNGDMYAWAPIVYGVERDEDKNITGQKVKKLGEKVSAGDLDLTDDQFKELVDSGAVRNYPLPDDMPENYPRSPRDWMMEKHKLSEGHLAGGYFTPDVIDQLQTHADLNEAQQAAEEEIAKHEEGKIVQKQPGAADAPKPAGATS
jgi:hypothetical protein